MNSTRYCKLAFVFSTNQRLARHHESDGSRALPPRLSAAPPWFRPLISTSAPNGYARGLGFSPGIAVQNAIWKRFGIHVNFDRRAHDKEFFLVLSIGRCKFGLTEDSVSLLLQAGTGGNASAFLVSLLHD